LETINSKLETFFVMKKESFGERKLSSKKAQTSLLVEKFIE